jgi:hypothetical protein
MLGNEPFSAIVRSVTLVNVDTLSAVSVFVIVCTGKTYNRKFIKVYASLHFI